jgi:hypothetical protein
MDDDYVFTLLGAGPSRIVSPQINFGIKGSFLFSRPDKADQYVLIVFRAGKYPPVDAKQADEYVFVCTSSGVTSRGELRAASVDR